MMRRIPIALVGALAVAASSACNLGHAIHVRRDQGGGVLALHGDQEAAFADAQHRMAAHCGEDYSVVAREQVVVGGQPAEAARAEEAQRRDPLERRSTTTGRITEHRLTYACDEEALSRAGEPTSSRPEQAHAQAGGGPATRAAD